MKKILLILLSVIMVFSCLTACSNDTADGGKPPQDQTVTGGDTGTQSPENNDEQKPSDSGEQKTENENQTQPDDNGDNNENQNNTNISGLKPVQPAQNGGTFVGSN